MATREENEGRQDTGVRTRAFKHERNKRGARCDKLKHVERMGSKREAVVKFSA